MDPTKKELYTAKRESGVDMTSDSLILETFNEIKNGNDTNWMLISLIGNTPNIQFNNKGSSIDEFINLCDEDHAYYGIIKVNISHHNVTCVKFMQVFYIGDNIGGMKRGKHSMFRSGVFNALEGCHGEIVLEGSAAVSQDSILKAIATSNRIDASEISFL